MPYLLLVMRHIVALVVLLFIFAAVDVFFVMRHRSMARHSFILHIVLTSASFHNKRFFKYVEKFIPFYERRRKLLLCIFYV